MTETIITHDSNPLLWTQLNNQYVNDGQPRNVTHGTEIYEVFQSVVLETKFKLIENLYYVDSRSNRGGRSASYNKLSKS
jgi:hypothetical protein